MSYHTRFFCVLLAVGTAMPAIAGISLDSTRIIYQEADMKAGKSIQVNSSPLSKTPYLVKTQITQDIGGTNNETPFIVTPSLFRLMPNSSNQVRILKKNIALPQDRESLFYFHAIAIPTAAMLEKEDKAKLDGSLQLASSSVIKLFYRPNGLLPVRDKAAEQLQLTSTSQGLKFTNPTPYYLTLSQLKVNGKAVNIRATPGQNMISPFSATTFPYAQTTGTVNWQIINDYGGVETFDGSIQ